MSELLYQGHGSFRITLNNRKVIYIDPYVRDGCDMPADLILVTHQHSDHNRIDIMPHNEGCIIYQSFDALKDGKYGQMDCFGVHIEAVQAYGRSHNKAECVGYLVSADGKLFYFSGDTAETEQMHSLASKGIDYAFLPIDGIYTMDIDEAVHCAKIIKAKHSVPVHMTPGKLFDREKAEKFNTASRLILANGEKIKW